MSRRSRERRRAFRLAATQEARKYDRFIRDAAAVGKRPVIIEKRHLSVPATDVAELMSALERERLNRWPECLFLFLNCTITGGAMSWDEFRRELDTATLRS